VPTVSKVWIGIICREIGNLSRSRPTKIKTRHDEQKGEVLMAVRAIDEIFRMVVEGRNRQSNRYFWLCPKCFTRVDSSWLDDLDRRALDHCLGHTQSDGFWYKERRSEVVPLRKNQTEKPATMPTAS
jgi:hypothetical protein